MINIIVNGCNGAMGQVLCNEIINNEEMNIIAGVDRNPNKLDNPFSVYQSILNVDDICDVIIDFSNPSHLNDLLEYSQDKKVPLVIATTGYSEEELIKIENSSETVPIFLSSNMSLGVNVLLSMVRKAANILSSSFDIEIIEKHHNKKVDAPSGTALMIANTINDELDNTKDFVYGRYTKKDKRQPKEVGIHAIRGGNIVGEHTVIFAGDDEVVEIKHTANSKKIFAKGSLEAAQYIINQKPGLYTMDNLLNK
ncbi:4-hydroxy-tetrahydrodipicolinate reductase [Clostridium sp. D2Q-11]|uniref:4-hydroxy-tetrahydrodipicolinate reductase n=1 Tax=Anaeromonas frigoriresistens TaxID=2683708 RepID=A0A942UW84_9FIRM|nr:4-hydroxy-tetrahydrodipicolinate reductase [Anaeromonas frigoriresistens]MBS4539220.1 4-hydroxy-tetrahydrodipicolinate reductase [Anaeromonas frigoriresistens]